jgi:hypothetical protein
MRKILFIIALITITISSRCQNVYYEDEKTTPIINVGIGLGLNYGGIGGRISFVPTEKIDLYAGLGYALIGFGYNIGAHFRMLPEKRV